ncbi:PE-PGRS family protein [Mycobacterium tuberculosis]|nr:PE-PGRS family protein [Mycobacterium tuberculosis]
MQCAPRSTNVGAVCACAQAWNGRDRPNKRLPTAAVTGGGPPASQHRRGQEDFDVVCQRGPTVSVHSRGRCSIHIFGGAGGAAGAVTTITHASFNDPHGVAVNPGGNVYVTNFGSGTVSVINPATNTVTGSPITIGNGPSGVAVSPVTGLVFVTNFDSNTVSVIDPTTNTVTGSPITVGTAPTGVAVNPVTGEVYVTNFAGDTVSVIS